MLHYEALRQLAHEHRCHHEAEAAGERLALQVREERPLPLTAKIDHLRTAHRHALERAGHVMVTVWPRR